MDNRTTRTSLLERSIPYLPCKPLLRILLSPRRSHIAKQVCIPDEDIQLLGRWTFSAYKHYIEVHPENIFGVSRRLQTSLSPAPHRARPTLSPPTHPDIPDAPDIPGASGWRVRAVGGAGRGG